VEIVMSCLFKNRLTAVAIVAGGLLLSSPAFSADYPLTMAEAQRRAVERSRLLSGQDSAVTASREMAVAASRLPDPVLKVGVDNLPINGADKYSLTNDFMTMRRIGVMQEITASDKRHLRADRYEREAEKTLAEKAKTIATIERDTALAWLDLYYTQASAKLIDEQAEQAKLEVQAAEGAYRASRGSQSDVFAARSALAMIDDRASELGRRIRNAKTMLLRWIGIDMTLADKPVMDKIHLNPVDLETQMLHHPEIAVLTSQQGVAEADAKLAQANRKSDWSVEATYQQRGSAYGNMVSFGVSIPLPWDRRNRQDRELSSRLAMADQARSERDEVLRTHVAETRLMINEWENNRERLARYERELIPLTQQRTEATLSAYRGGKAALTDVLAARRNEIDVRLQALQLEADTARLWAQLNFLSPTNNTNSAVTTKEPK